MTMLNVDTRERLISCECDEQRQHAAVPPVNWHEHPTIVSQRPGVRIVNFRSRQPRTQGPGAQAMSDFKRIPPEQAQALREQGAVLVDVRDAADIRQQSHQ
jgi:hypothetical protein